MRKRILVLLILFLLTGCNSADSSQQKLDSFVEKNFYDAVLGYFIPDDSYSVGKGISVSNQKGICFYPVYHNDELVDFLEVIDNGTEIGINYPSNMGEGIRQLLQTGSSYLTLFANSGIIYGYAGDKVYDFRKEEIIDAASFNGKLPEKNSYDRSSRLNVYIPVPKGTAVYLADNGNPIELTYDETCRLYDLLAKTLTYPYQQADDIPVGFVPQFSYSVTIGNAINMQIKGYEPLGSGCIISDGRWGSPDPYGEFFDYNRELMLKYEPEAFARISDDIYDIVSSNGLTLLKYEYYEEGKYIDWGVYSAAGTLPIKEIFREFNMDEQSELTLEEYFFLQAGQQADINTEVKCGSFSIKLIGKGSKGTTYYIRSYSKDYDNHWGFVIHDK